MSQTTATHYEDAFTAEEENRLFMEEVRRTGSWRKCDHSMNQRAFAETARYFPPSPDMLRMLERIHTPVPTTKKNVC